MQAFTFFRPERGSVSRSALEVQNIIAVSTRSDCDAAAGRRPALLASPRRWEFISVTHPTGAQASLILLLAYRPEISATQKLQVTRLENYG